MSPFSRVWRNLRYKLIMNKECLQICNFGPIVKADINNIGDVNVFIGESGSGKSTVMKILALCRWLYKMQNIRSYLKMSGIKNVPFRLRGERVLSANGLNVFIREDSRFEYNCGSFECSLKNGKLKVSNKILPFDELCLEKIAYISDKRDMIPDLVVGNVVLKHGMFFLEETLGNFQKAIDSINTTDLPYLNVKMDVKKTSIGRRVFVSSLSGDSNFTDLPLRNASSGIQNTVALHFILKYFVDHYDVVEAINSTVLSYLASNDSLSNFKPIADIGAFKNKKISLMVEEPELSLFPSNQRGLVNFIVSLIHKSSTADIDITMATHSPYILTSLNVLLLAHRAMEKDPKATESIIGRDLTLPLKSVGAWEIKDGCSRCLIDEESGLIDGTWLDSVSEVLDNQFFELNNIIYG